MPSRKKKTTSKKATKKKATKRKDAKPDTYEEAHWGWRGEAYLMDLALRLIENFSVDPDPAAYQQGVDHLSPEIFDLASRDAVNHNRENNLGQLAEAIQLVNARSVVEPWKRLSDNEVEMGKVRRQWTIVYQIKRDLDRKERDRPPTIGELMALFEEAKCPERHPNNARKKIKHAGWALAESPRGRPRSKS